MYQGKITKLNLLQSVMRHGYQGYFVCFGLLALVASIDYSIGFEMSFSFFYLAPIALLTWSYGKTKGVYFSILSAIIWAMIDYLSNHHYSNDLFYIWNATIRLFIFLTTSLLVALLKVKIDTDSLTSLLNRPAIFSRLHIEVDQFKRTHLPFTIALLDLDNFKSINDTSGHIYGDYVLQETANILKNRLRITDALARIGGDEFLFILPDTTYSSAQMLVCEIIQDINLAAYQKGWPISASAGVVSCEKDSFDAEKLINLADELMYSAKHNGHNNYHIKKL